MHATVTTRPEMRPLSIGLCVYGFGYSCGFMGSGTERACPDPYDLYAMMDLAVAHHLGGVEFPPLHFLADRQPAGLEQVRTYAAQRGLYIVADGGVVDIEELRTLLPVAASLGAQTVRMTVSHVLCGDRRAVRDTWAGYLSDIVRRLKAVRGLAEELGVAVGIENHQDMTSEELVAVCEEVGSPQIGVTLDAINPLAVVEDPLTFAGRIMPYLKHVHLKDYYLYKSPEGFRLVRCAVGSGVLNVPAVLAMCAAGAPAARICIEIGAHEARHVRLLEDDFWPGYPPRRVEEVLPVLRLRETRTRPEEEDWRTPWERGDYGAPVVAYEMSQFKDSVAYLSGLEKNV
jgi:sugar phosphate isomerase/epimerase